MIEAVTWIIVIIAAIAVLASIGRRGHGHPGAAAAGTIYDMLQEDKRKALEVIVEERAAARDLEHVDADPDVGDPDAR